MSKIFAQLLTQEAEKQRQAVTKVKNDIENRSDVATSQPDVRTSQSHVTASKKEVSEKFPLEKPLMNQIISSLSDAKVSPALLSIRMTEDEKEYIEDFILDTLRKEKLQGHEVSMSKLMRYALTYLLLKHQREFVDVLKETLLKDESRRLFQ